MTSAFDLHCHSTASDGKLPPAELVARAAGQGVTTLALTDHDTLDGLAEARAAAAEHEIRLVSGIELSCVWGGATIHIVGLDMDTDSDAMQAAVAAQLEARKQRSVVIAERLSRRLKVDIPLSRVQEYAGGELVGRPHFAQYLLDQQLVPSMAVAFKKYLGAGKPGDVKANWPALSDAVRWIVDGGGIAVMAHAHIYKMTRTKLKACIVDFIDAGGRALEVSYGNMDADQQRRMVALAQEFELLGSCGSDFHGPNRFGIDLGVMPAFPADIEPVWQHFRSA
ncbi:phosphatase [Bacterioplanes sanyensis]|uniref:PHP domain-containing protein n=1 Tax=Bacterioplanes sanyensis TaxID=1249553 RepID=UPI00199B1BC8|nr:PHP domain-containing protein [Bacterioplanes sanyensis]GGY32195.1 phosphatase [Bacterioplanes sanyensis]